MITTFASTPRGRRLAPHRLHPQQRLPRQAAELHGPLQPLRAPRLPGAAERPARVQEDLALRGRDEAPGRTRPASAARATAASTTPRGTGPPGRPCAPSTATRSRSSTATSCSVSPSRSRTSRARAPAAKIYTSKLAFPGSRERPRVLALPDPAPPLMATRREDHAPGADPVPARLARGALGHRRRDPLLPVPQRPGRHQLVPDARLGDADRVPRPGLDGRDPRDVLPAGPRRPPTRRSSTSRTTSGAAGSSAACTSGAPRSSSS